ncbi:LysR family transcriptional regulator [Roseomonas arctica]|uniref:LysR family transcriptional regulator n=1 Tax=Plastoroseomonas arctica TaxID=1509237 RepID=A0AAF1KV04_9PROT|nr:LysR family transcriptional regulator [Plastoroseomonas arctica]
MDLDALRLLIDVARHGSFAEAARARATDPSSVSRIIAGLEAALGFRLFQRTTRRLTLTEAGALYLDRATPLAESLEEAADEARANARGPVGTLRLTTSVAFAQIRLAPLLAEFRVRFPALKLELLATDAKLDLVAERVDLAIRLAPEAGNDFIGRKLFAARYRVVATRAYRQAAPALDRPEDLRRHRCLRFILPEFRSRWMFRDAAGLVTEVPVDGDITLSNALVLHGCALAGLGPALLPEWLVGADLAAGRLVDCFPMLEAGGGSFDSAVWLLYPSRKYLPNKVRVTVDFLTTLLKK